MTEWPNTPKISLTDDLVRAQLLKHPKYERLITCNLLN